jgi:superkiller protein 3
VISTLGAIAVLTSDPDLLEATISELNSLPLHARLTDTSGQSDLVLFTHALAEGREEDAIQAFEEAVLIHPSDGRGKNRLAKLLLATGKGEEALRVLRAGEEEGKKAGIGAGGGSEEVAERLAIEGMAEIVEAEADEMGVGVARLQKAVMVRPWEVASWEALAWGRQAAVDV